MLYGSLILFLNIACSLCTWMALYASWLADFALNSYFSPVFY